MIGMGKSIHHKWVKPLPCFCSRACKFESNLVGASEVMFSHDVALMIHMDSFYFVRKINQNLCHTFYFVCCLSVRL